MEYEVIARENVKTVQILPIDISPRIRHHRKSKYAKALWKLFKILEATTITTFVTTMSWERQLKGHRYKAYAKALDIFLDLTMLDIGNNVYHKCDRVDWNWSGLTLLTITLHQDRYNFEVVDNLSNFRGKRHGMQGCC